MFSFYCVKEAVVLSGLLVAQGNACIVTGSVMAGTTVQMVQMRKTAPTPPIPLTVRTHEHYQNATISYIIKYKINIIKDSFKASICNICLKIIHS